MPFPIATGIPIFKKHLFLLYFNDFRMRQTISNNQVWHRFAKMQKVRRDEKAGKSLAPKGAEKTAVVTNDGLRGPSAEIKYGDRESRKRQKTMFCKTAKRWQSFADLQIQFSRLDLRKTYAYS
ncbi:MAG: hypothetical protein WDA20_01850 [Desulfuromonadales bacterium]